MRASPLFVVVLVGCSCGETASAPMAPPREPEATATATTTTEAAETPPVRTPLPPPRREDLSAYSLHLRDGRRAAHEERWADAVRELEAADEAAHGDSRARGELGWALFHTGDLERASELTRDALDVVDDPRRRGMLLYNLGRILEERGERDGAENAYVVSLRERPNDVVRARLVALRPEAIDRLDPERAAIESAFSVPEVDPTDVSLCGTYPTPAEWDALVESGGTDTMDDDTRCEISERLASADGRFEVAIVALTSEWQTVYLVYLRSGEQWLDVDLEVGTTGDGWEGGRYDSSERSLRMVETATGPIVEIDWRTEGNDDDWCEGVSWSSHRVAFCGPVGDGAACFGVVTLEDSLEVHEGRIAMFEPDEIRDDADSCATTAPDPGSELASELAAEPRPLVTLGDDGLLTWEDAPPALAAVTDPRRLPCVLTTRPSVFSCP